jgi:DNA-binding HxlR family transcriptional regulator
MRETSRSGCPINLALEVFGDRWSLLILRDMIFAGKRTFNQLLDSDEGIATNVLRDRLNSLVDSGLLTKSDDPERKGRTRYALTERAITLVPALVHLGHWGERWLPADPDLRRMNRRLFTGGPALWGKIMDELRA